MTPFVFRALPSAQGVYAKPITAMCLASVYERCLSLRKQRLEINPARHSGTPEPRNRKEEGVDRIETVGSFFDAPIHIQRVICDLGAHLCPVAYAPVSGT